MTVDNVARVPGAVASWIKYFPGQDPQACVGATVVFPHAGAAAGNYRKLAQALAARGDTFVVQYPRRAERINEPPPETVHDLARDLFEAAPWQQVELDNVVITGGNRVIGRQYARYCIEHGARRVTLLSRKGLSPPELDHLADGHAVLHAPLCDVTNPSVVSAVAAEYAGDGASLLIHAAGTATFAPHDQLTAADLDAVFGAKVTGLARMVELWPLRENARILLCSSVSGLWGGYGHAAYAASNRMLDVLAGQLRAKGLDCTPIRWGLWQDTTIGDADEMARIERSGLVPMDPDAAITASLRHHGDDPLILAADFDRLHVFFETQSIPMPFTTAGIEARPLADSSVGADRPVDEVMRAELAPALSLSDAAWVDMGVALVDLGVDSLLALDLRKRLSRLTGCAVPLARLLGGITGRELIDALQQPAPPLPKQK